MTDLDTETPIEEHFVMVRRVLANLARRVGAADCEALEEMGRLRAELEGHLADAVRGLRHDPEAPASWAQIGEALGMTRQSAQQRYGHVGGLRTAGGQPADWR